MYTHTHAHANTHTCIYSFVPARGRWWVNQSYTVREREREREK